MCWFPCYFCETPWAIIFQYHINAVSSVLQTNHDVILALLNSFGTEHIKTADTQLSDVSSSTAYLVEICIKIIIVETSVSRCGFFLMEIETLKRCACFRDDWLLLPKYELYWRKTYHWFGLIYSLYSRFKSIMNLITQTAILPSAMSN